MGDRSHTLVALGAVLALAGEAEAACNLIPSASKTFRGALGDVNRPFAGPGDFVEVGASPSRCAGASPGFGAAAADQIVTVVFEPPSGGAKRVAFLTTLDCGGPEALAKTAACEATVGPGHVACVQAGDLDPSIQMAVVDRNGERRVSFRFPDTDALLDFDFDGRVASGPATIAVTPTASPLPCALATTDCASQPGLLACVDEIFAADGSCDPVPDEVFPSFTALPQPNDFQAACFTDDPPCTALASEAHLAVDGDGNLLLPVHWSGVLIRQNDVPVPRLIRATIKSPLPFPVPDAAFLASYTPEGAKLPPIFEPQADPSVVDPDVITLFGSADASYTILRFARRAGICDGGPLAGSPCSLDRDCRGGTCPTTCVGGASADLPCTSDAECEDGRCGALFTDFRPAARYGGPLALRRQATGRCFLPPHASCAAPEDCPVEGDLCIGAGICQLEPHGPCASDADCPTPGDACVSYAFEATTAIPLESLTSGSTDVFSFTVNESTRLRDENGDGDTVDSVVTLRDRVTGVVQPMGGPPACGGIASGATGRAVVRISDPPFRFPAVETEDDLVAFLESESAEGYCDQTGDADRSDALVRVFALDGGERTATLVPVRLSDGELLVNQRALAISNRRVFYRRPERGAAPSVLSRVSVGPGGVEADLGIDADFPGPYFDLSSNGQAVLFMSPSTNLVAGDTNGLRDAFVHDRATATTERVNLTDADGQQCCSEALGGAVSADGRWVAFGSLDGILVPGDTNGQGDVFVRDRVAGTTERVSVATGGGEGSGGHPGFVACDAVDISADGRFVLFYSQFTNLVPNDTNEDFDLFVHDRATQTTERVSLRDDGGQITWGVFSGAISADGRYVVFPSFDAQVVPNDGNFTTDVFVRDRFEQRTERVSVMTSGADAVGLSGQLGSIDISDDGRFVVFGSEATLAAGDTNGERDIYIHDRWSRTTELASVATGGLSLPTGVAQEDMFGDVHASISGDGRYVAFTAPEESEAVPGDTNNAADAYVYDRLTGTTERVSVGEAGEQALGGDSRSPILSFDGSVVAFRSGATNLVPGDGNAAFDAFVRRTDDAVPGLDLFPDGVLDDTLLEVFDADAQTATTLCPADEVAVAAGRAAFLRPESIAGTVACPGGSLNPPDADTDDLVVQLWESGAGVQSLGLAATSVVLSASHVAALGDEAGESGLDQNGDGDAEDQVVHVRALGDGAWTNLAEAADALSICGAVVPFITPEAAQGADRNSDGDQDDRVLQVWAGSLTNTGLGAEELVCEGSLVAFRSPESTIGPHRNGDADDEDLILSVYDAGTGLVHESQQAVTPCTIPECDPRLPYRIVGRSVKFLTLEPEQGPSDLNGDGDALDLVIQSFDLDTGRTKTIGTVRDGTNPLGGGDTIQGDRATVYVSTGRCLESLGGFCVSDEECPPTAECRDFGCVRETGVCRSPSDCPPGSACTPGGIVPASPDEDGDGVPDHLDNCPATAVADQTDTDGDGVGDPCDVSTCGNDVQEGAEVCDGSSSAACPGACTAACTCCSEVADPKASVQVRTKKEAGVLTAKMSIALADYDGEPVTVRFTDTDSDPIALASPGPLPPKGKKGTLWEWKTKSPGVQLVQLEDDGAKHPGTFKLVVRAKKWFTAAQANRPAADSRFTVTIGAQCFGHAVTKKKD